MNKRHLPLILLLILIAIALVWPVLFGGKSLAGGDLINHFIPIKTFAAEQVRAGEFPHWNSLIFSGRPLQADIQTGIFYPPSALFLLLPAHRAFDWLTAAHFILLILGAFAFFRKLIGDAFSAAIAATAFAAGGFFTAQLHSGIVLFIFTGAWLPWMLWAAERGAAERRPSGFLWLAIFGAVQLLAGAPQVAFYSWLLVGMFLLATVILEYRHASKREAGTEGKSPFGIAPAGWAALGGLGAAAALAAALTAVQWMPTREFLAQSFDRAQGASWEFVTDGSFEWDWLPTFAAPFLFGHPAEEGFYWGSAVGFWEFNGYIGVIPLALAFAGLLALGKGSPRSERRLAVFALLCVILWLCLAPGAHSPIFKAAYYLIPGFSRFRVPARWVLAYQLGMAALAAIGLRRILFARSKAAFIAFMAVLAIVLLSGIAIGTLRLAALEFLCRLKGQDISAIPAQVLAARQAVIGTAALHMSILAAAGMALVSVARWWRPLPIAWVLIVLIGANAVFFAGRLINTSPTETFLEDFYPKTAVAEALEARLAPAQRFSFDDTVFDWTVDQNQQEIYPNRPMLHGLPSVRGYDPVNSLRYGQLMNALAGRPIEAAPRAFMFTPYPAHPRLLALLNTSAFLSYQPLPDETFQPLETFAFERDLLTRREPATLHLYAGLEPVGEAFLARPIELGEAGASPPERILSALISPQFDWRNTALIESGIQFESAPPQPTVMPSVESLTRTFNKRTFLAATPESAVLVLSESWYPGWRARIDGREQPAFPADWALTATHIPPGTHEVEFYYLPKSFEQGRTLSLAALVVMAALCAALAWLTSRRHPNL